MVLLLTLASATCPVAPAAYAESASRITPRECSTTPPAPYPDSLARFRSVYTSGLADDGQAINAINGLRIAAARNFGDLQGRVEQVRCEFADNAIRQIDAIARDERPPRDCSLRPANPSYIRAVVSVPPTGMIDKTATFNAAPHMFVAAERMMDDLQSRISVLECFVSEAYDDLRLRLIERQLGAAERMACIDSNPSPDYTERLTPNLYLIHYDGFSDYDYKKIIVELTSRYQVPNLRALNDLQVRLGRVQCLQRQLGELTQFALRKITMTASVRDVAYCGAAARSPSYNRNHRPWAGVNQGTLLTRLLDWDNWQSAALDDLQMRINALNCNQQKINDDIFSLVAGLDVEPTPLISYQLVP